MFWVRLVQHAKGVLNSWVVCSYFGFAITCEFCLFCCVLVVFGQFGLWFYGGLGLIVGLGVLGFVFWVCSVLVVVCVAFRCFGFWLSGILLFSLVLFYLIVVVLCVCDLWVMTVQLMLLGDCSWLFGLLFGCVLSFVLYL